MNAKIVFGTGIFFVLLFAVSVFAQTASPNVNVTVDLGEELDSAPSDQPPSGNWWDLENIQNQWNNFAKQFQAPVSKESPTVVPPSVQVSLPEGGINPQNNSVELDVKVPKSPGVDAQNDELDAVIKIDSGNGEPVTIASIPISEEALDEQRIQAFIPSSETKRPLEAFVEVVKRFSREPVAKSLTVLLGTNNPNFGHVFVRLPTDFGERSVEEQRTVFENASEKLEELPASDHFFKTVFVAPIENELPNSRMVASGKILASGSTLAFDSVVQPPFGNSVLYSQSGFGSIRLSQGLSGPARINGDLLFFVANPNEELPLLPRGAIPIQGTASKKPVSVFYELGLYPLGIETGLADDPLVFYQNPFELKRALPEEEPIQPIGNRVELKKEGKTVREFVGPPSPEENQADSACIAIDSETAASLPANSELELQANGQFVSKYVIGLQLAVQCFPLDGKELNSAIQSVWEKGKKLLTLALVSKTANGESVSIAETVVPVRSTEPPKKLRFAGLKTSDGKSSKISSETVFLNPIQSFSVELEGINPYQRLYLFVSPLEKQKTCSELATYLQKIMKKPFEEHLILVGEGALADLNPARREEVWFDWYQFSGDTNSTARAKFDGLKKTMITVSDAEKSLASEPPFFKAGEKAFFNVPISVWSFPLGLDANTWKLLELDGVALNREAASLNGKAVVLNACQFGFAAKYFPRAGLVSGIVLADSAKLTIQLGDINKDTLLGALLELDKRFVGQLFTGSTALNPDGPLTVIQLLNLFPPEQFDVVSEGTDTIEFVDFETSETVAVYEFAGKDPETGDDWWKKKP